MPKRLLYLNCPAYDNISMLSKEGQFMAWVPRKKANFYINKGLAFWINDGTKFQLNFVPKGIGASTEFEKIPKSNQCVVCKSEENLTRHHVIPTMFRKSKLLLKDRSHDVLLLCGDCHVSYEKQADVLKNDIQREWGIPLYHDHSSTPARKEFSKITRARLTLENSYFKIPLERRLILEALANKELPDVSIDETRRNMMLERISNMSEDDSRIFIERWRNHFVSTMQPKYLPDGWAVTYMIGG